MTIEELIAAMRALLDEAEGRDLTDEEVERYAELEAQLAVARRSAEIRKRQEAYETPVATPTATPAPDAERRSAPVIPSTTARDPKDDLERAFIHYLRTGKPNDDIAELRAQGTTPDAAGGYLVPEGFRRKLVERMVAFGGLAGEAEVIETTSGNPIEWPTVDDTANTAEIVAENGTFAAGADVTFGTATLGAYKYMAGGAGNAPLKVSWELLQDSAFDIEALLTRVLGTRIARLQATHWVTGNGTTEPEGIVTPKAVFDSIAGATPTYAELLSAVHALDPAYRANAKWLMSDATLADIEGIVGTDGRPLLWNAGMGLSDTPALRLLGYPVVIDQAVPDIAAVSSKSIVFGDLRESYVIRRVRDIQIVVLNELYAANGQVGFMAWARADGAVQNANSYVILGGPTA